MRQLGSSAWDVLVLYLKRPPSEELGFETLCKGASDTAT
jgi:hypothetical protein